MRDCARILFFLSVHAESENIQAPKDKLAAATKETDMEDVEQGVVEQSVVTLMGEIGKHIEGQLQEVEGEEMNTENSVPVTTTTVILEEGSEKG